MITSFLSGRWDESLVLADAFIASGEAGSPHAFEAEARCERALISLARDSPEAAIADVRIAVELARDADPQVVEAVFCAAVKVLHEGGHVRDAEAIARELLDFWAAEGHRASAPEWVPRAIWALVELGLHDELRRLLDVRRASLWLDAARAELDDDIIGAAETFHAIGAAPYEAETRLRASVRFVAEGRPTEANEQLERGLTFWRSIDATRYVREGEQLLTKSA
jgi:hypothetical protein